MRAVSSTTERPRAWRPVSCFGLASMLLLGCGPNTEAIGETPTVEYLFRGPSLDHEFVRDGRELELLFRSGDDGDFRYCGTLRTEVDAERARAIAELDPAAVYDGPTVCESTLPGDPSEPFVRAAAGSLHLAGFENAPFDCFGSCCPLELKFFGLLYAQALAELTGSIADHGPEEPLDQVFASVHSCD